MRNLLIRTALVSLFATCLVALAPAQDRPARQEPKYHYAYRHLMPDGSETMSENWDGSINWDTRPKQDELWVQRDGKDYLITDKQTLDSFEKAFGPLRDFNNQRSTYMDGYYKARGEQRGVEHSARSIDRQISSLQRRADRAKTDKEKSEYAEQIKDLQQEKDSMAGQQKDAVKKLDQESKKREEFYKKREEIRAQVYKQTDKLIDGAMAKGLAKPSTP